MGMGNRAHIVTPDHHRVAEHERDWPAPSVGHYNDRWMIASQAQAKRASVCKLARFQSPAKNFYFANQPCWLRGN